MSQWLLAVNPSAGRGRGAERGQEVAGLLRSRGEDYELITANTATQLRINLESALNRNPHVKGVISVGGDGLAHLILQLCVPRKIPFAPIPAGTGNDLVRTLGWSVDSFHEYVDAICSSSPVSVDLGLVDGEWFANILSTGFDSVVNERANRITWPSGPSRYNVAIALELPVFKPRSYMLTLNGSSIQREAMLIAIANGICYGGGMKVAPHANLDDGLFDIMVLNPVSKVEFLKVFPKVYGGTHVEHPAVEFFKADKIELHAGAVAYADGERIGQLPIRAECVAGAGLTWRI